MSRYPAFYAVLLLVLFLFSAVPAFAQDVDARVTDYLYSTNTETTSFGDIIWFYQESEMYGPVRSNDVIGIKNTPTFYDEVITTEPDFIHGSGYNPIFMVPPTFNAPVFQQLAEPHTLDSLAVSATRSGTYYDNNEGAWQSRIEAVESGWHLQQWTLGDPYPEEGPFDRDEMIPYSIGTAIYVEGHLDVFGDRVRGIMTVACTDTMILLDNVMYAGYSLRAVGDPENLDPRAPENAAVALDLLGLVAGSDILVGNTVENGRGNGGVQGPLDDHSNKHIVITAAMFAQNGEFSFENQNNNPDDPHGWDGYWWCDPEGDHALTPDERGAIFLHGSMGMSRRGYVHRSNCGGTGYEKVLMYDHRFRGGDFPGMKQANVVDLTEPVTWQDTTLTLSSADDRIILDGPGTLTLGPGTEIHIDNMTRDWHYAFWGGQVELAGSEDNPVRIVFDTPFARKNFRLFQSTWIGEEWSHVVFEGEGTVLPVPPVLTNVSFFSSFGFTLVPAQVGEVAQFDQCLFRGDTVCDPQMAIASMTNSVVEGTFTGSVGAVDRCTFVDFPRAAGIDALTMTLSPVSPGMERDVRNTVFVGNYESLLSLPSTGTFDYNAWYDTQVITFDEGITVGSHVIVEQDPLFWNPDGGDYHLMEGSPLIDAGDPDSDLDPDGSRADIGAFPYDPTYTETPEVDPESGLPMAFGIENLYPNPFNGMTTLSLTLPQSGEVEVTVVDLLGRQVEVLHSGVMRAGRSTLSANLATHPSGLYFIVAQARSQQSVVKAMLVK
ncbi:T9SS type A sorting domain-containing protein [bacterium]|nr:T9SS type A sorting domain-containing protein [bacterium]